LELFFLWMFLLIFVFSALRFELSVVRETAFRVVRRRKGVFGIPRDLFPSVSPSFRRNRVAVVAPAKSWGPRSASEALLQGRFAGG